ncbi:5-formyltetrahydrofolate cyclo-ligase [Echinicola sp. CAU 1574]|uniref:5-formyltetrahydrofolate cyclo-ligase n=1 Tax=Echinicola arenosa TaxID=2774144 RepID=A0ABR9ALE2_9BACT|nr:5-formyltetrahydrofolate cyclo-ligase [Echinicola arenosa]MBD8489613.1 5-formyltetrahydrofolate cyclo-ligase [Echinicola arenosa]
MDEKARLRSLYKSKRKDLGAEKVAEQSLQIKEELMKFLKAHDRFHHFHIFLPIARLHEIDTFPIVEALLSEEKQVYTSVSDFLTGELKTVKIDKNTTYSMDKWGIPIPESIVEVPNEVIEVVFLPLLAYDLDGNRIGYGKGFYDRFLFGLKPEVFKVGLSYFVPEVSIPVEEHDIRMDICILPGGIIEFN